MNSLDIKIDQYRPNPDNKSDHYSMDLHSETVSKVKVTIVNLQYRVTSLYSESVHCCMGCGLNSLDNKSDQYESSQWTPWTIKSVICVNKHSEKSAQ